MTADLRIWQRLRETRAGPPGRASSDKTRAAIYRAALEQFEELMVAAKAVGPAARPLPLFYALSQAGRAVAAAHGQNFVLRSHGLAMNRDEQPPFLERLVDPRPSGSRPDSFGNVAAATGSDTLTQPVAIGEVWSAIPDLTLSPPPRSQATTRRPLYVVFEDPEVRGVSFVMSAQVPTRVVGFPDTVAGDSTLDALTEELGAYESAAGFKLTNPPALVNHGEWGWAARVLWEADGRNNAARRQKLDEIAPEYRFVDARWLIPSVGSGRNSLSPLMLWWTFLFALSNLARYEPSVWIAALELNSSDLAVPLAAALDEGLSAIPHLVLDALLVDRHLIPRADWAYS